MNPTTEKIQALDPHISRLLTELRGMESDDSTNVHGENLAYIFRELIRRSYSIRSRDAIEALGVLECCKQDTYAYFTAFSAT